MNETEGTWHRETRHNVVLPPDLGLTLESPYNGTGTMFRPARLTERLTERPNADVPRGRISYEVTADGPVQTAKGRDHANRRGMRRWYDGEKVPDELRPFLVGTDVLSAQLPVVTS